MTRMGCSGWMFYIWKVSDAGSRQSHNARPAPCLYCKWKKEKKIVTAVFEAKIKYKCTKNIYKTFLAPTMKMGVVLWLMVGFAFQASEYKQKRISAQRYKFKYTNMKRKKVWLRQWQWAWICDWQRFRRFWREAFLVLRLCRPPLFSPSCAFFLCL